MTTTSLTSFISDDRCIEALQPLVKDGSNELPTFIVCVSNLTSTFWHLPKVGPATLHLTVREGDLVEGAIAIRGGDTFTIDAIDSGLSGNCVALIIRKGQWRLKLYLNIPLCVGANPALSALQEITKEGVNFECVEHWLKRMC